MKKFICNYHFVSECMDLAKTSEQLEKALKETKCTGLETEKESTDGRACEAWSEHMKEVDTRFD